jgi:molybdopterin converting factor subunit 1
MKTFCVAVKLFALYRDLIGTPDINLELHTGSTVEDLCNELRKQFPDLPQKPYDIVVAINQEYAHTEQKICVGDEIAIIPPVSGGCFDTTNQRDA